MFSTGMSQRRAILETLAQSAVILRPYLAVKLEVYLKIKGFFLDGEHGVGSQGHRDAVIVNSVD